MSQHYKAKITHLTDEGDKLELETWVEASSHDAAFDAAKLRLTALIGELSAVDAIEIDKSKIEFGCEVKK